MYWYEFSTEWFIDGNWLPGAYLATRDDDDFGIAIEWCFAGPQPAD